MSGTNVSATDAPWISSIGSPSPRTSYSSWTPFKVAFSMSPPLEQYLPQRIQGLDADNLAPVDVGHPTLACLGYDAAPKAELLRLAHAQLRLVHRAHLAGEADFADHERAGIDWLVEEARGHGRHGSEVGGGLVDREAAGDVEKDVLTREVQADLLLEDGDQQREPVRIDA